MNERDLHNYQTYCSDRIIDNTHTGLFLDMGLGKTVATLTAISKLIYCLEVGKVVIIAPKRVARDVWIDEIQKWEHLNHLKVSLVMGTEKQRLAALKENADIYTISRDNVSWLIGLYGGSMLPFDMCVIDESSSFKNHKSLRFKALKKVQPCFDRVVLLTGTPSPKGLINLWSQLYLLDRGERLGRTISEYRRRYFTPGQTKGHIVYNYNVNRGADQLIKEAIKDVCVSMTAKDYLDLPEVIENDIELRLTPELQDRYKEFEKEKVLELLEGLEEGEAVSAVTGAALSNKLIQFANGVVYDEDKNAHLIHEIKLKLIEEIVEDAEGDPILIAWSRRSERDLLMERLKKYKPREFQTREDMLDWNEGKIKVMMMHPASGGHGSNLQYGGNRLIWYSLNWDLELYQQFNARLARQGQTKSVTLTRLLMAGTEEMRVARSLASKGNTQADLMKSIRAKIKKYSKDFQK